MLKWNFRLLEKTVFGMLLARYANMTVCCWLGRAGRVSKKWPSSEEKMPALARLEGNLARAARTRCHRRPLRVRSTRYTTHILCTLILILPFKKPSPL